MHVHLKKKIKTSKTKQLELCLHVQAFRH